MKVSIIVYGLALSAALGGAYWTWTDAPQPDLGEAIVLLPGEADELEQVVYESPASKIVLDVKSDARGRYTWVSVEPKGDVPPPAEPPANPHAPPPDDGKPAQFKAGKSGDALLEQLAPFKVQRALEGLDEAKLQELGLAEPDTTLTIARAGREPKTFEISKGPFGGTSIYVRDAASGEVYVASADLLRPLETAKRVLSDRLVLDKNPRDIGRLRVQQGEQTVELEQHHAGDPAAAFWSVLGETEPNPTAAAWIDKALRLQVKEYLPPGTEPPGLSEAYRFSVAGRGGDPTTVVVYRGPADGEGEAWYARSEHTRTFVRLERALAAETAAEVGSIFGAGE